MDTGDITIGISGSGGDGVVSAGDILVSSAAASGINCMMLKSFGPQIRGGESSCRIRLSTKEPNSQGDFLDVLVVFGWANFARFISELEVNEGAYVLVEENDKTEDIPLRNVKKCKVVRVPFEKLAKDDAGNPKAKNMVMLGVLAQMFNIPSVGIKKAIERKFIKKGKEVVTANHKAVDVGIDYVKKNETEAELKFVSNGNEPFMALAGNDAVAFGALVSGCRFFTSYPITPASEIMEYISREMPKFDGVVLQAEDEISAVNAVIGASFGGIKAMTATSGPGLSLKLEAIGLAVMAELPIVVVNVQRGGPSTGMPTKTEQADLMQSIYGMHGDAPHAVLAPGDVKDCFEVTTKAFGIAEEYQMPVIILSDQFVGQRKETIKPFDLSNIKVTERLTPKFKEGEPYIRYVDTPSGISPISAPGMKGGAYLASGIEHTEDGFPTSLYETHERMVAKRERKVETLAKSFKFIMRYGVKDPEVGVLAWGSSKGVVKDAIEILEYDGMKVAAMIPQLIYPLQKGDIKKFVDSCKHILVIEMSHSGQFEHYLAGAGLLPSNVLHYRSSGGRIFTCREIVDAIRAAAKGVEYKFKAKPLDVEGKDQE